MLGRRRTARRQAPRPRASAYYEVAGVNLRHEAERLRALPVFAAGELAARAPAIKVRRASRPPNRLGFAVPQEWRISITSYPGIRPGDAQEALLHELVHLHVGAEPGHQRWHGQVFKETLRRAMAEAYGVCGAAPRSARHGAYADALEERRTRPAVPADSEQLAIAL